MRDELREAFIRSLARYHGLEHAGHDGVERTARAYLDSLEKAKPEPPGCKHQWWRGPENEEYCNQCGHMREAEKPEPPKERTPEEILEDLAHDVNSGIPYKYEHDLAEALRLVRALREERDKAVALAAQRDRILYLESCDRVKAIEERDELRRRIEKAIKHERDAYGGNDPIIRILEGK